MDSRRDAGAGNSNARRRTDAELSYGALVPALGAGLALQLGEGDCEIIGEGLLGQPVNTLSSLAYVLVGMVFVVKGFGATRERRTQMAYGATVAAVGLGSVAFHGPMPPGAELFHDLAIAAAIALIAARAAGHGFGWPEGRQLAAFAWLTGALGLIMVISGQVGLAVAATVGLVALAVELFLYRATVRTRFSSLTVLPGLVAVFFVLGGVGQLLGRTGGPLCDPGSVWQAHAAWHVATAAAFALYGVLSFPRPEGTTAAGTLRP